MTQASSSLPPSLVLDASAARSLNLYLGVALPPRAASMLFSRRAAPVLGKPPGKKSHNFCSIYSCGGCRLRWRRGEGEHRVPPLPHPAFPPYM